MSQQPVNAKKNRRERGWGKTLLLNILVLSTVKKCVAQVKRKSQYIVFPKIAAREGKAKRREN